MKKNIVIIIITSAILLGVFNCEDPHYPDSIWDPDASTLPDPKISSISPSDSVFGGIGIITITGDNFSTDTEHSLVYFNGVAGNTLAATKTELLVQTPNLIADSVMIKVAIIGAYQFAEYNNYKLYPPVIEYGGFDKSTDIYGMAMDLSENIFLCTTPNREIVKVFSNGVQDSIVYGDHSFLKADAMKMGPGGDIYLARRNKQLSIIPAGGGTASNWKTLPSNTRAYDLDFDQYGNLYTGGRNNELYRINVVNNEDNFSTVASYPEDVHVNSIRIFDGYVYIVGEYLGDDSSAIQEGIWKNQIVSADSLGPSELVIDWKSALGSVAPPISGLVFAEDGYMYIAVADTQNAALYEVSPPYSAQVINPAYAEVFEAPASNVIWGNSHYLYVYRRVNADRFPEKKRLYRIDMIKQGAPYYGRQF